MNKPAGKYAWTAKVGERGQIVIPKEAREVFDIHPGDTLLLLGDIDQGIAIVKNDHFMQFAKAILEAQKPEGDTEEEV
ncbi:AbrB/MazE/SpoVT family DNA-binding domain-containing protein [Zongyangia hominis]|uniref:AbrB/MazE/SpoVT family DNA-binding domain-containing protein n=1 Tax=Zongyangia hominis TaxID=2763677 RepID=A0A926EFG8_9FIRM|nr:AbrB/MazE/SpoVT family DNA-binding domain-containing protein [Zongyangia hominis]MBC8571101.1 AbrB/MazE/SpoVT family DNA-binding domain-containing protein [Zongyangia hominis]